MNPMNNTSSPAALAPGFRFHPTDEELVFYYLRRKICGKSLLFDAISEIDIYKIEPWDLPGKSRLQSRDMEWYFFSGLDKKYGGSQRTNRATEKGYWKTTGKDREVYHRSNVVGMKKTLVYHFGRAPRGQRTNWVVHEYKLIHQDALVLCRIFQKSGPGPKNGEQYGAPLIVEEWENEEFELPTIVNPGKVEVGDNDCLDGHDLEQILGTNVTPAATPLPLDFHTGNNITFVESRIDSTNGIQNFVVNDQPESLTYEMPYQDSFDDSLVQQDSLFGSSTDPGELDFVLDESFWDASENLQFGDAAFFETDDLMDPIAAAHTLTFDDKIDEFLSFHDVNNDTYGNTDIFNNVMSEGSKQAVACQKEANVENHQAILLSKQHNHHTINTDPSSVEKESEIFASDCEYAFLQKASKMLGSIPAPPAFGAEFPGNHAALRLNSYSPVHVTAGVIQVKSYGTDWSLSKDGGYSIIFSFGLSRGNINSSAKSATTIARGWTNIVLFSFLALSVSFKLGALICGY